MREHKANVTKGYDWLAENLPELELIENGDTAWQIEYNHDQSKSSPEEYEAYDAYFYGGNRSYRVVRKFQHAWLHHIHNNPHHWQYWVLHNDEPDEGEIILRMPYEYIIEMICDWWSFSWKDGNLREIFSWYDQHKDYMKLHELTRAVVENILEQMKKKMDSETLELEHHGIKGQKWGVRRDKEQLAKLSGRDTMVEEAIKSGEVSKTINSDKQRRHTKSDHLPGRSYLDGDLDYAQKLVDRLSGTGKAVISDSGEWLHMERVENSDNIGVLVDNNTGKETKTNKAMIRYSKTGTHIHPRKG